MKVIFIHLIFFFQILLNIKSKENINETEQLENKTEKIEQVLDLDDSNFDSIIQNGKYNRWLIIFYLETCYHCYRARSVLNRILELRDYQNINNIKFASVEVEKNSKCNDRFKITQVPYIILVENGTMIEFDSYANEKNLINFIGTNFTNITNDLKSFPSFNLLKYYYHIFENSIDYVVQEINNFLESNNINFKITPLTLVLSYIVFCFIIWSLVIFIVLKYFDKKKNNTKKNENENDSSINNKENNNNNKINDNKIEKKINKNINKDNDTNDEEKKIMREKMKEKEKYKENNDKDTNINKEIKKEKKKKKE